MNDIKNVVFEFCNIKVNPFQAMFRIVTILNRN